MINQSNERTNESIPTIELTHTTDHTYSNSQNKTVNMSDQTTNNNTFIIFIVNNLLIA